MKGAQEEAYLKQLAARVRERRKAKGLSRRGLAEAVGVSDRYVTQLESGRGNVSILLLRKLARALDVPVEDLVPDDIQEI